MTEHAHLDDARTPAKSAHTEHVWLRPGVHAATTDDGTTYLVHWPERIALGSLTQPQHTMLRHLATEPQEVPESRADTEAGSTALVERLRDEGWLHSTVRAHGTALYTLDPIRTGGESAAPRDPANPVLSRFAVVTRHGATMVLSAPRGRWDIRLHDPRVLALLSALTPATPWQKRVAEVGVDAGAAAHLLRDLAHGGFLADGDTPEGDALSRDQWNGPDLWFHANSRFGTHQRASDGFGKTRWISGESGPLPHTREPFNGRRVQLDRPDLDTLRERDPSLTAAVEDSRSIRQHDHGNPISVGELGAFLYRCARSRERYHPDGSPMPDRPYPSGGASYEIEFYPLVRNVEGLAAGLYHYDPVSHELEVVSATQPALGVLARTAQGVPDLEQPPQVLIILAARFGRVMREYQGLAYALTLKHVGVVYQLMYTVATAMGLAPCALGAGDAEAFSEAVGSDYLAESSVGEFILGSRKPE